MVKYDPKSWFSLIFEFHKSDTFRQMFWVLAVFAIYCVGVVYAELHYREWFTFKSTILVHSLLGFVIGLLLVFRTNTAYERWWEGRKAWGQLVNDCRNLALKLDAMLPPAQQNERRRLALTIGNYPHALKNHLRAVEQSDLEWDDSLGLREDYDHHPNNVAALLHQEVHRLYKDQLITGDQLILVDKELKSLTDVTGACERIRNTPIPYSYNIFIKKFIFAYTLTMPFGLVSDFNYWAVPIAVFTLYVFGSLEILAEEIEDPFGTDSNDLPTDMLSQKIRTDVKKILLRA
ncbi:MAG: hypothetical protein RL226_2267 [Bacteroidota bacterium]